MKRKKIKQNCSILVFINLCNALSVHRVFICFLFSLLLFNSENKPIDFVFQSINTIYIGRKQNFI